MTSEYDFNGKGGEGNWQVNEDVGHATWGNEISSYWCGKNVDPTLTDDDTGKKTSGTKGAKNPDLGDDDNIFDKIKVSKKPKVGAMLFKQLDCKGTSVAVIADTNVTEHGKAFMSSDKKYSRANTWGWTAGEMKSVHLDSEMDLEVFNGGDFKANAITVKNYTGAGKCFEIKQGFKNLGSKESLRIRGMTLGN